MFCETAAVLVPFSTFVASQLAICNAFAAFTFDEARAFTGASYTRLIDGALVAHGNGGERRAIGESTRAVA